MSEVLWGADINGETNTFYASFMSQVDPYGPGYGGNLRKLQMISSDLYEKFQIMTFVKNGLELIWEKQYSL
ncbi:hypothetical protein [Phocaeicola dorei]|uniref:hypothetical protein n=1 Tax=Phocaeicola dorei TaxID=357276 RepID=UPI00211E5D19|nr:hypothetical protein [Phocaeicola dorei]